MEPIAAASRGSEYEGMVFWGFIALGWTGLSVFVLRRMRAAQGATRKALFVLSVLMLVVLATPFLFFAFLVLLSFGATNPEGPVGIGGAAFVAALVSAVIVALIVTFKVNVHRANGVPGR